MRKGHSGLFIGYFMSLSGFSSLDYIVGGEKLRRDISILFIVFEDVLIESHLKVIKISIFTPEPNPLLFYLPSYLRRIIQTPALPL